MGIQVRERTRPARPVRRPGSVRRSSHPLLDLQASVGNRAVTQFVQRRVIGAGGRASDVQFRVGTEISTRLATQARRAAPGGVDAAEFRRLRATAVASGGTVTDDERMFLAGLMDAGNAAAVAAMTTTRGSQVTFSVASVRPQLRAAADLGRTPIDPAVDSALLAARADPLRFLSHLGAAHAAAVGQIHRLFPRGPLRVQADRLVVAAPIFTAALLRAMLAAASDSTPGDRILAGTVYLIAAQSGHPMADALIAGTLQVDQLPGSPPGNEFAHYRAFGADGDKGDTIYAYSGLDHANLAHRRAVIHELEHAADDESTPSGRWRPRLVDDAEVQAYRAGSKYALERLATLDDQRTAAGLGGVPAEITRTGRAYRAAVTQLATEPHPIHLVGLALEAHSNLTRFEMRVVDVNAAFPTAKQAPSGRLLRLLHDSDAVVEQDLRDRIRAAYGLLDASGNLDPAKNLGRMDGRSGPSVLDTIDLPRI